MPAITRMKPGPRMSAINICNGMVYLAGQTPDVDGCIRTQAENMLAKVDALLREAGSGREHMLAVTIYLRDMKDFAAFNEVYDAWIPAGATPGRACVEARMARENILCEAVVIATLK